MSRHERIAPADYRERTEPCGECHGSGRWYQDYYDRGNECPGCSGTGEWSAVCAECGETKELNDDGICRSCVWEGLAETVGDPLLKGGTA